MSDTGRIEALTALADFWGVPIHDAMARCGRFLGLSDYLLDAVDIHGGDYAEDMAGAVHDVRALAVWLLGEGQE